MKTPFRRVRLVLLERAVSKLEPVFQVLIGPEFSPLLKNS